MGLSTSNLPIKERLSKEVNNEIMRKNIAKAQDVIGGNRAKMVADLEEFELWRDLSKDLRNHVIANLDAYLYQLSEKVTANGGKVFFAKDSQAANQYITEVCQRVNAKKVVKSKSMVTEEIGMNHALEQIGVKVIETDLAEIILQVSHDAPSHIVVPALHLNRDNIKDIFSRELGYEGDNSPENLTAFARATYRKEFLSADVGVSGCNFAVPETGTVCLVTNEGNLRMATTLPKVHIAVMGMERIAPTFKEVDPLITMLARSAVGTRYTSYNTWLTGPRLEDEIDGPEEFHLVILDNKRSEILKSEFKEVLRCIRCGACLNTCPAYRQIGGHGYGSIYPGPIGAVISPLLGGYEEFKDLPYICSLCSACDSVCPVKIPLHQLIWQHRQNIIKAGYGKLSEKVAIAGFSFINNHSSIWSKIVNIGNKSIKSIIFNKNGKQQVKSIFNHSFIEEWDKARDLPQADNQSFREWFKERKKGQKNEQL